MHVCMYVCLYVCMYVFMYVYINTYIHACMYVCMHVYYGCNMCIYDLTDMHALYALRPSCLCIHISQITCACVITVM